MIIDDLKRLSDEKLDARTKNAIVNKYKVDLIYYMAIEKILNNYGTHETDTMDKMHSDALGCARDQMASRLSDAGIVKYNAGTGDVENINFKNKQSVKNVIKAALENSEALRAVVTTSIASRRVATEMSDEELFELTDREFEIICDMTDGADSLVNQIYDEVENMDKVINGSESDYYAMNLPIERIRATSNTNSSAGSKYIPDVNKTALALKISPLMPEIRELRLLNIDKLNDTIDNNALLMYDVDKKLLIKAFHDYNSEYGNYNEMKELSEGVLLAKSEFMDIETTVTRRVIRSDAMHDDDDNAFDSKNSTIETVVTNYADKYDYDIAKNQKLFYKWRMINIFEKYSQQSLNDADIRAISDIIDDVDFAGDSKDPDVINKNADAYFDYLEHICSTVKSKMSSHEFEIHLTHVPYLEHSNNNRRNNNVFMLYMTGERTSDLNRAKSNNSRFFSIYPYVNYVPVTTNSIDTVSPAMGDIASASYNTYIVSNNDARKPYNAVADNPFISKGQVTAEMIDVMRDTFDAYMNIENNGVNNKYKNIAIRKMARTVGDTSVRDLLEFVDTAGNINSKVIIDMLIEDMNSIKNDQRVNFSNESNRIHFKNIIDRFINDDRTESEKSVYNAIIEQFKNKTDVNKKTFNTELYMITSKYLAHELRESFGESIDSYIINNHIFSKYLKTYIDKASDELYDNMSDYETLDLTESVLKDQINNIFDKYLDADNTDSIIHQMYKDTLVENINDPDNILEASLNEIYGEGDINNPSGKFILKPNMCKYASKSFRRDMYEDMLRLLSHTDDVYYELDMTKDDIDNNSRLILQLYSSSVYQDKNIENDELENSDEDTNNYDAAFDDVIWYSSTFAKLSDNDISYQWLTSNNLNQDEYERRAVYIATHPLQVAAMTKIANDMKEIYDNKFEFDKSKLRISAQGVAYYKTDNDNTLFKIGPIIDERAYIRPYIEIIDEDHPEYENAIEIERVRRNSRDFVIYDDNGKASTEKVKAIVHDGIVFKNNRLMNPVVFGALDTKALTGDDKSIPNRFYGISAQVDTYDGYKHDGQKFADRMQFSTYKTSILDAIDKNMALYKIAKYGDKLGTNDKIALSILYTNVCASSLSKCYHTNTYILENKVKCDIADRFMSEYVHDPEQAFKNILGDDDKPETRQKLQEIVSLVMMQSEMYHDRVVMPKITVDQNITLYNQVLNLQQCNKKHVTGLIDRKNMRNSDSKSMRVVTFADNPMFDPVFSGTAKQLGAVVFFTDAVKFDDLTGKTSVLSNASISSRCTMASTGVIDFVTDSNICRFVNYPGGQSVDRLQLSGNAIEKALNYAKDVKFAMINMGYNMEDGYIVAKRAVSKFGHFGEDYKYHDLELWDKIGDTESGNKGVVAKIVNTDIKTEDEFRRQFVKDILKEYEINYCSNSLFKAELEILRAEIASLDASNNIIDNKMNQELQYLHEDIMNYLKNNSYDLPEFSQVYAEAKRNYIDDAEFLRNYLETCDKTSDEYIALNDKMKIPLQGMSYDYKIENMRSNNQYDEGVNDYETDLNKKLDDFTERMLAEKIEPFNGKYKHELVLWRLFNENPDLDLAITNVCVNTRSNPSLLMYITDSQEKDESLKLIVNGEEYEYATGIYNIYVDSHTAEDKNRDYTKAVRKSGRKYGSQEMYALQAKHCMDYYIEYATYNDTTLADRISKFNRRCIMNGVIFNPNDDFKACSLNEIYTSEDFNNSFEVIDDNNTIYQNPGLHGYSFIDTAKLAESIMSVHDKKINTQDCQKALEFIKTDLNFGPLLSVLTGGASVSDVKNMKSEDMLHHIFVTAFAKYGGNFMILPENMTNVRASVYHEIENSGERISMDVYNDGHAYDYYSDLEYGASDYGFDGFDDFDNNIDYRGARAVTINNNKKTKLEAYNMTGSVVIDDNERTIAPLFVSSREIVDSQSETVSTVVDDKLQFNIFKCVMGNAMIDILYKQGSISENDYNETRNALNEKFEAEYKNITNPKNKSLDFKNVQIYMKKNIYNIIFSNSLTCVWAGDPTLAIDEVGISFDKAKALNLLRPKKGLTKEQLQAIPDDYEHMAERYEPLKEDDIVQINRSPGQTTGCIRVMRPKIISEYGDGIKVHPAVATILDGDFDGDTIGVINPKNAQVRYKLDPISRQEYDKLEKLAMKELMQTMSMQANLVQTSDYTEIKYRDKDGNEHEIDFLNPLFIAGNADIAIAKYTMSKDSNAPYDVSTQFDYITVIGNIIEQRKQLYYDGRSGVEGHNIELADIYAMADARNAKINECFDYLETLKVSDPSKAKEIEKFKEQYDKISDDKTLDDISKLERDNKNRLSDVYKDITQYISSEPCFTHGTSQLDMICNIIKDTNISKKGKEPQLNALLVFSGIHKDCDNGCLKVIQHEKKYVVAVMDKESNEIKGILKHDENNNLKLYDQETNKIVENSVEIVENLKKSVKLSYENAISDVPKSKHRTQTESNIAAQSDKSDATGFGGSMAQKMQKIFAIKGFSELGLRISGPITQVYLDAKQNVTKCEKNLKIAKAVLNKVCSFQYVHELSDEYINNKDAKASQIYNGQFTFSEPDKQEFDKKKPKYLTLDEGVSQLNNLLVIMGQPPFSEIDKKIVKACLVEYLEEDVNTGEMYLKNVSQKCDKQDDFTYACMYGYKNKFSTLMYEAIQSHKSLWEGSNGYFNHIDRAKIVQDMIEANIPGQIKENCDTIAKQYDKPEKIEETQIDKNNDIEKKMETAFDNFEADDYEEIKKSKPVIQNKSKQNSQTQINVKAKRSTKNIDDFGDDDFGDSI